MMQLEHVRAFWKHRAARPADPFSADRSISICLRCPPCSSFPGAVVLCVSRADCHTFVLLSGGTASDAAQMRAPTRLWRGLSISVAHSF